MYIWRYIWRYIGVYIPDVRRQVKGQASSRITGSSDRLRSCRGQLFHPVSAAGAINIYQVLDATSPAAAASLVAATAAGIPSALIEAVCDGKAEGESGTPPYVRPYLLTRAGRESE